MLPVTHSNGRFCCASRCRCSGLPPVYPQTPAIVPYHNRSVWPFVQAFWNLAAAKLDDGDALLAGMSSIARSTALLLTNKENFVLESGDPAGTGCQL